MSGRLVVMLVLGLLLSPMAWATDVLGTKPGYLWGGPSSVPNEQAITRMIWAPGLDEGYVPQGLTVADGAVLVAAYLSKDIKQDRGPCRVYSVDAKSGQTIGWFDMPEDCGHAGGLAYLGNGRLVVGDTRRLYLVDLPKALQEQKLDAALLGSIKLAGTLKTSFIDFDGVSVVLGASEKDAAKARVHFLPPDVFETQRGKTIKEDLATRSLLIGTEANGMAFDRDGKMWLTFSNSKKGLLQKLDPSTGAVLAEYEMVIGIEDLGFDAEGKLWSVSEAGTQRWSKWSKTFPVIFQTDTARLR